MKKFSFLFFSLCVLLSSCTPEHLYVKTSEIKDVVYETRPVYDKNHGYLYFTHARFLLDDGMTVPVPDNFSPVSPETYVGKRIDVYYWSTEQLKSTVQETESSTPSEDQSADGYKYICYKKYVSDGKFMIKYYTKSNTAIKTVEVTGDVYSRAKEGFYMETEDFEPFVKPKK